MQTALRRTLAGTYGSVARDRSRVESARSVAVHPARRFRQNKKTGNKSEPGELGLAAETCSIRLKECEGSRLE